MKKRIISLLLIFVLLLTFIGCSPVGVQNQSIPEPVEEEVNIVLPDINNQEKEAEVEETEEISRINEDSEYSSPEDVSLYIHTYNKLPSNFITKNKAMNLGWDSGKGNLWEVTDNKSIGGDKFGNRERLLPKSDGRVWYECDVNYEGGFRGAERVVFSNDGLIYYTNDHYESFEQLY